MFHIKMPMLLVSIFFTFSSFAHTEFNSYPIFDEISYQSCVKFVAVPKNDLNNQYIHEIKKEKILKSNGHTYIYELPPHLKEHISSTGPLGAVLFENDTLLRQTNCFHNHIKTIGKGKNSFFSNGNLYFSTLDNSNPKTNDKKYYIAISMNIKNISNNSYEIKLPYDLPEINLYSMYRNNIILKNDDFNYDKNKLTVKYNIEKDKLHFSHQNNFSKTNIILSELDNTPFDTPALDTLNKVVFVLGAPRSGTTVLSTLICGDDSYPAFNESVASHVTEAMNKYQIAKDNPEQIFLSFGVENIKQVENLTQRKIDNLIASLTSNKQHKKYISFKEPFLTLYSKYLKDIFKDKLKIIYVVRDPRDVISSWKKMKFKNQPQIKIEEVINDMIPFYNQINIAEKMFDTNTLLFIRYEDLVEQQEQTLSLIDRHLGYEINRTPWKNMAYSFSGPPELTNQSIGNYKKYLSITECNSIVDALKIYMKKFGYT